MRRMWDAAFPPPDPPMWEVAAGYIGGNTPHVWTDAEWARQTARYRLPIFTRSHNGEPNADARASIIWLGVHQVPKGVCVAIDFEDRVDPAYVRIFDAAVVAAGWKVLLYGQLSTVRSNPKPSGGYWVAHWTGVPHLEPGSAATQWSGSAPFGGAYDPNLVADSTPLWEVDVGLTDADKTWIDENNRKYFRFGDHGADTKLTDLTTRAEILAAVKSINVVASLTDAQLDQLATLVAAKLEISGLNLSGNVTLKSAAS